MVFYRKVFKIIRLRAIQCRLFRYFFVYANLLFDNLVPAEALVDALLRAFEQLSGVNAVRPNIAGNVYTENRSGIDA